MTQTKNICSICGKRDECKFKNDVRIVCKFATLHFEFGLPPNCFDCVDLKLCIERYKYNQCNTSFNFRCTGMKLLSKDEVLKVKI